MTTRSSARPGATPRWVRGAMWLGVLVLVAVAGSGLVMSLDHPPTEQDRPELTARGHAIVAPRLAAMAPTLSASAAAADTIAAAGRDGLIRLRALDIDAVDTALATGGESVAALSAATAELTTARDALFDGTVPHLVPSADRDRVQRIDATIEAAHRLGAEWQVVAASALTTSELVRALDEHDTLVSEAAAAGRDGDWALALDRLADAEGPTAAARAVREEYAEQGAAVTLLDDLLRRSVAYADALERLYRLLRESDGTATDASRAAFRDVEAAEVALPADRSALVVVVSDLAGPTITGSLLRMETQRATMSAALPDEAVGPAEP